MSLYTQFWLVILLPKYKNSATFLDIIRYFYAAILYHIQDMNLHLIFSAFTSKPTSLLATNKAFVFYIHGSVHRESNTITVQRDATVFSLLHFCRQLYMFRVLTPIIRSSYNCNYSFWHWSTGPTTNCSCCWVGTSQQWERMVVDPVDQLYELRMMGVSTRNM